MSEAVTRKTSAITSANDMDVLAECQHLLEDSVRLRLRSDVPLAVSLSGGLDSSTVAAYSARHVAGLEGFTYGAPNDFRSEGPVVAAFSRAVGIDCNYIWPQHGPLELDTLLERVLKSQEAPFGGLSVLAQNEVFRRVRESGFKVLLGGQGGDEAFAGYRKFFIVAVKEALRKRSLLNVGRLTYSMGLMLAAEVSQARWYWQALSRYNASKGFKFRLVNWASPSMDLWGASGSTLSSRQELDILQLSLPTLLRLEDRNSMGYGLETRLPFLDYRVIEMALALPARLKIAKGYGKWALRRISEGVVPDSIRLTRKKRGFDVAQSWVERGIGASLRRRLHENRNALSAHLRPGIDLDRELSIAALARDGNLLDEALMLAWLAQPVRI